MCERYYYSMLRRHNWFRNTPYGYLPFHKYFWKDTIDHIRKWIEYGRYGWWRETTRRVTYQNVKYGMLVEILHSEGSYHGGCKVYFFNHKGVLVGNYYKFLPYEKLRLRLPYENGKDRTYPRYFMNENSEQIKTWLFIRVCNLITWLIKFTQKYMHKY